MAKVIPIGEPVNEVERLAIAHLRDGLPEGYLILHNFEVVRDGEHFEVDLAVVAPHAVYLVDVKGTRGLIEVHGPKWYPEGRQPYTSPLLKLGSHARSTKGIITASQPGRRDLEGIYVEGIVLLSSPDAVLQDPGGRDAPSVTTLKGSVAFFQNAARVPGRFSKNIAAMHNMVLKALQGVARPRTGPIRFGNWEVTERLSVTDQYVEYRAVNGFAGARSGTVILRAYQADPYLPEAEREAQRTRISNAYLALNRMSAHPCIVGARDFFPTESEDRYILVTEDVAGQALRLYIDKPHLALTLDQKLCIASDLLSALEHAHKHDVVHRHITPSSILVGVDGRVRLTGFDFARAGTDRSRTIADAIVDDLEAAYLAPEMHGEPGAATPSSDIFSAGLVLYELFTGERPFANASEIFEQSAKFSVNPSAYRNELTKGFDAWLQMLCTFDPASRPTGTRALAELDALLQPKGDSVEEINNPEPESEPLPATEAPPLDYSQLASGASLTHKYIVEKRLGKPGAFGVVYKVIDTLGDVSRALKLILRDRHSTLERLKKEYRTLLRTPEHPNVVKVIDADLLPNGGPPFIVFEFIEGLDVGEMIDTDLFAPEDAVELARQVSAGLLHLHQHGVYHCDIKPRNLLWTDRGVKIIDFNVSVLPSVGNGHGGGSRRYLPPDIDLSTIPQPSDLADRDLYALGLTLFEAVTGRYPWETAVPPLGQAAPDPREWSGYRDLAPEFVDMMLKAIAPRRADRFSSAGELIYALGRIDTVRRAVSRAAETPLASRGGLGGDGLAPPNTNPYVSHLLTLYSQSQSSNSGTRGLDVLGLQTYVETALDRDLVPAVFAGEFSLVIISGNAGDGKTAFLQKLEKSAELEGAVLDRSIANGCRFTLHGRTYVSNYDGSQDEGEQTSDAVLRAFFKPFAGETAALWPTDQVRLIAINEGRLVDFLSTEKAQFPLLSRVVSDGLVCGEPAHGVAVINLNLRSVVAAPAHSDGSILDRLIRRMTGKDLWKPCHGCDLKETCYAFHNAQTFQDETASPKVIERLGTLYTLTHLRGRLHITLRDLRSALSFMLVGTRDCAEIHELYRTGNREEIAQSFYFNSWMDGTGQNSDRLLRLLREVDVGLASDPKLDRSLDFVSPSEERQLFRFGARGTCDRDVLRVLFDNLPREFSGRLGVHRANAHQAYVAMARRRNFFERRDAGWKSMLPYQTGDVMLSLVRGQRSPEEVLPALLQAINRGEGLCDPERLGGSLALQVREVTGGTIRSYRLYPKNGFTLEVCDDAVRARFVEHMPSTLVLRYRTDHSSDAELPISLDVFEMLQRLNEGYRPSVEEEQGYYLSLTVFKNVLGSAPYQEVLLTTSGYEFFKIQRHADGRLDMNRVSGEAD